jgi:signal transduction histidine kinase
LVRILLGSRSPEAILPDLILFVAVVIIGVFLIRAGLREAKLNIKLDDLNHNLQKKVDEQTKEIRTAYEVEKKARVELEELNHAKNDFILASQHNLRTPLTVANGYIEQIGMGIEKGDIGSLHTYLDKTTGAMETMGKLVNGLIDVTDLKVGKGGLVEKTQNK